MPAKEDKIASGVERERKPILLLVVIFVVLASDFSNFFILVHMTKMLASRMVALVGGREGAFGLSEGAQPAHKLIPT